MLKPTKLYTVNLSKNHYITTPKLQASQSLTSSTVGIYPCIFQGVCVCLPFCIYCTTGVQWA